MIEIVFLILAVIIIIFLVNSYQNKYQSFQGVVFNILVIVFLFFFLASTIYVYLSSDISIASFGNVIEFGKVYFAWIIGFFKTIGNIAGYVIKQNWGVN